MWLACVLAYILNLYWFYKMYKILVGFLKSGDVEGADQFTSSAKEDKDLKDKRLKQN